MWKKYAKPTAYVVLICLMILVLAVIVLRSQKLEVTACTHLTFQGEYSQNGGPWQSLNGSSPSILDGDVVLRGSFSADIPAGETVNVYLNHVDYRLLVNGTEVHHSDSHTSLQLPDSCSARWDSFTAPAITAGDTVELYLHNPHSCGDAGAYLDFLDNIYAGPTSLLIGTLAPRTLFFRAAGTLVTILAVAVMGVAAAFTVMRGATLQHFWSLGLISLCMGGYLTLDNPDSSLLLSSHVFTTYGELLCLMAALLELNRFLSYRLKSAGRRVASLAMWLHGGTVAVLMVICLTGRESLYNLLSVWSMMQLVLCPVLMGCCIYEWVSLRGEYHWGVVSAFLLLVCTVAELFGTFFPGYPNGLPVKLTFLTLFVVILVRCIKSIVIDHRQAIRTEQLQTQLLNNSVILALSQIRTHFIFNVLNAISGMCKYDPEKADQTVVRFSRYLRSNVDVMHSDQPVLFEAALRHVEDYVALEQIRFGEKLRFVTDIEVEEFQMPPLILQPLVENAIRHGIMPRPAGGTVTLCTRLEKGHVLITVSDDGVGYDPAAPVREQAVGLENVRYRLQHMARGTLHIESTPGRGTVCTVFIPEEEAIPCE